MAVDISIDLSGTDHPIPLIGSITHALGVNIRGVCTYETRTERVVHILLDEEVDLDAAIAEHGVGPVSVTDVVVLDLEDRPGVFAAITSAVHEAGIALKFAYTSGVWLVLGSDDAAGVRAALAHRFKLDDPRQFGLGTIKAMDPSVAPLIDSGGSVGQLPAHLAVRLPGSPSPASTQAAAPQGAIPGHRPRASGGAGARG